MKAIEVKNLDFSYGENKVLNDINFTANVGDVIVITGENGSGKSTLIKVMTGENTSDRGEVNILEEPIDNKNIKKIGYVPQSQGDNFIAFPLTSKELVVLQAYDEFGFIKIPSRKLYKKAEEILKTLGLEEYINTPVSELSGGLRQRVMIARALMNEPSILIFDEPTAGVDEDSKKYLADILKKLNDKHGSTIILVTHELSWIKDNINTPHIYKISQGGISC